MQQYSHRNGETDLPEVAGMYWVRDKSGPEIRHGNIVQVEWEDGWQDDEVEQWEIKAGFIVWCVGSEVDIVLSELGDECQWWGPIQAPWEES